MSWELSSTARAAENSIAATRITTLIPPNQKQRRTRYLFPNRDRKGVGAFGSKQDNREGVCRTCWPTKTQACSPARQQGDWRGKPGMESQARKASALTNNPDPRLQPSQCLFSSVKPCLNGPVCSLADTDFRSRSHSAKMKPPTHAFRAYPETELRQWTSGEV